MKMQGPILGWIGNGFRMVAEDPASKQTSYIHPVMHFINILIAGFMQRFQRKFWFYDYLHP